MTAFDRYVVVDWSAAGTPRTGADSVWIAELDAATTTPLLTNPPTRRRAEDMLHDLVARSAADRTLVLVDASLGFPAGATSALGLGDDGWRSLWVGLEALIDDDERNRNNRFEVAATLNDRSGAPEGPFWGAPDDSLVPSLRRTKPAHPPLPEFRETERRLRVRGWYPKSVWQLMGAGSVGSQTLTVVPVLERLRRRFVDRVGVWPFTTGLREPRPAVGGVVIAEVWPSRFATDGAVGSGSVKDAAQVTAVALDARDADRTGALASWWSVEIDAGAGRAVELEEGWVAGPA